MYKIMYINSLGENVELIRDTDFAWLVRLAVWLRLNYRILKVQHDK